MGRRGRPAGGILGTGPLRRGGRRGATNRLGDVARQRLGEARQHYRDGAYTEAAALFERMAGVARERGMPRVATHLSARAAACHAHLGAVDPFETSVAQAIEAAREDGDQDRTARTFGRLVAVLADTPLAERADAVREAVRSRVGVAPRVVAERSADGAVNRSMRRHLPPQCASCGAPVDAESAEFNDDGSVDCDTCGGLVSG